jgi:DNA-binding transcriptional LysR family regulator
LTPAGRLVLEEGRRLLTAADQLVARAREVATGWEPRLCIGVESLFPLPELFSVITAFLAEHPGIELDIAECVLNGGWEALEQERVDVIIGVPGPVPRQLGYRAEPVPAIDLVPVIASCHPEARALTDADVLLQRLPGLRRVVTHDTSNVGIARSAGLDDRGAVLYVQNMDQKVAAIRAGSGIGHLPRHRADSLLASGELQALPLASAGNSAGYIAWKVSSRGRGLQALTRLLLARFRS